MFGRVVARLLGTIAIAACTGSCLVISDPDFRGQEDCVPFFVTQDAQPALHDKTRVTTNSFQGDITLSSCALAKTYYAHVFLDGATQQTLEVPPTGTDTRQITVLGDLTRAQPGCHQLEVYASSSPTNDPRAVEEPDGIAYVVWWFADTSDTKFDECGPK